MATVRRAMAGVAVVALAATGLTACNVTATPQVAAGSDHTCQLRGDGTVACWGDNTYGQLGDGTTTQSWIPVTVTGLTGVTATQRRRLLHLRPTRRRHRQVLGTE